MRTCNRFHVHLSGCSAAWFNGRCQFPRARALLNDVGSGKPLRSFQNQISANRPNRRYLAVAIRQNLGTHLLAASVCFLAAAACSDTSDSNDTGGGPGPNTTGNASTTGTNGVTNTGSAVNGTTTGSGTGTTAANTVTGTTGAN